MTNATPSNRNSIDRNQRKNKLQPSLAATMLARTIADVQRFINDFEEHDPTMAFAEAMLGGKKMLVEDLLAEVLTSVKLRTRLRVSHDDYFVHGEESLAIRRTA